MRHARLQIGVALVGFARGVGGESSARQAALARSPRCGAALRALHAMAERVANQYQDIG